MCLKNPITFLVRNPHKIAITRYFQRGLMKSAGILFVMACVLFCATYAAFGAGHCCAKAETVESPLLFEESKKEEAWTGKNVLSSVGKKPALDLSFSPAEEQGDFFTLDFRGYVKRALKVNPTHLMDREEFNRYYLSYMAELQAYGFNVSLSPYATLYYDDGLQYGADLKLDISKILYDGGKRGILEKEMDIVTLLSRANLIESRNKTVLIAANHYSTLYYAQQELALLKRNFEEYTEFMRGAENSYRKGVRFSSYDYYSAKSQHLLLERELLRRKAALLKAETAFRQFGGIETKRPIRLMPLSLSPALSLEEYQAAAIADNSAIGAARLRRNLQLRKIEEREAERGLTVKLDSSLGVQMGSSDYTGSSTSFGSGSKPIANVGITATLPLADGGVRKTRVMMEQIEALKQKLLLRKTTEDIIVKLTELYTDYQTLEKDLEISGELTELNTKRLRIARERFEKGLEEYRAVQEAWNDALLSEIETIRERVVLRKTLTDLAILSGRNVVNVCREN